MRINFKDNCAWFERGYLPNDDERRLISAVTEALPDPPEYIKINAFLEYVAIDNGPDWVEYYFNVQGETELPLKEAI